MKEKKKKILSTSVTHRKRRINSLWAKRAPHNELKHHPVSSPMTAHKACAATKQFPLLNLYTT
ncbi:hypothetical protein CsSME_00028958 [Camellia sinensis var. sinensis]